MRQQPANLTTSGSNLKTLAATILLLTFTLGTIGPSVWADGPLVAAQEPAPTTTATDTDIAIKASSLIPPPPTQLVASGFHADLADPAIVTVVEKLGKIKQPTALPSLQESVKPSPYTNSRYLQQAWKALQSSDNLAALRAIDRKLKNTPDSIDALQLKAYTLARMDRHDAAIETLCHLLEQAPSNAEALRNLAIELGQSTSPQALKELEDMASADPSSAPVQVALARQYDRKQEEGKALAAFDRAVRLAPQNAAYRIELASLYDRYGYPSEAATLYQQAYETSVNREEADENNDPAITSEFLQTIRARADYLAKSALRAHRGSPNAPLADTALPNE